MINLLLLSIENVVFLEYLSILSKLFELYIYPVRYLTTEFIRFVKKIRILRVCFYKQNNKR